VKPKRKSPSEAADNTRGMSTTGTDAYLRNAVMTATPEQLQLMLYDGAIRFASQGRDAILAKDYETTYLRLSRAQKIILEMQNGLRPDVNPALCSQMASLYNFIYRKLVDASINRDVAAVDDALRILQHQRETWVMLMDKLKTEKAAESAAVPGRVPPSSARAEAFETTLSIEG
jgi:flagellar secretion chaperone FliS